MDPIKPLSLQEIRAARNRISGLIMRTPLVRLNAQDSPADIHLKLENLQAIGSFKLRGAGSAIQLAGKEKLAHGVYTASAGNMGQGVAWVARCLKIPCTVIVPDHAPQTKVAAIEGMGAKIIKVPFEEWWNVMVTHRFEGVSGLFVHPVSDPAVIAGNGTIGLEILEDLPDVDVVVIPYGGGGLSCGIASAIRAFKKGTKIYACEVETACPFSASLAAGEPREVDYTPSFVDGIGGKSVLPEIWPLASSLLDGSLVMKLNEVSAAIRTLIERNHVIAEGAGATPVAAALSGKAGNGKIVCVVSGGNIDSTKLAKILNGEMP